MHDSYLTSNEYYSNNARICGKESNLEYFTNVQNHTNTQSHLLDDNYYSCTSFIFSVQNKEKPKLLSSQEISESSSLLENGFIKGIDHASNNDLLYIINIGNTNFIISFFSDIFFSGGNTVVSRT